MGYRDTGLQDRSIHDPAAAAETLAGLHGADALSALSELDARLGAMSAISDRDETDHARVLALMMQAGEPHVAALLAPYMSRPADRNKGHKPTWPSIRGYLEAMSRALCASGEHLLEMAAREPTLHPEAAGAAARAVHACRLWAKACFVLYLDAPRDLWRMAYGVHRAAESADCADVPVRVHGGHRATTTVTHELARLLLLQCSAPELMSPAQVQAADRVIEQVGGDFTLRPRGVADNPFCFDPTGDAPPRRAGEHEDDGSIRYFGPGSGYDALERMHDQVSGTADAHGQLSAMHHLLAFWAEKSPYTPRPRTPAAASTLQVVPGYSQAWQQIRRGRTTFTELSLAEEGDEPLQAPETWKLLDTGGRELGVEIPKASSDWMRCGDVIAISMPDEPEWWLGLVRSMHADEGCAMRATIHVLTAHPAAWEMRCVIEEAEEKGITEQAARQFSYSQVHALLVSDGDGQPPNLLMPPDQWKPGRTFELGGDEQKRYVRCVRLLRQGDDYVRVTFAWVS
jgi:hypothetical protein